MREADHDDFAAVTVSTYEEAETCRDALRSSTSLHLQAGDKVAGPTQMAAAKRKRWDGVKYPFHLFSTEIILRP